MTGQNAEVCEPVLGGVLAGRLEHNADERLERVRALLARQRHLLHDVVPLEARGPPEGATVREGAHGLRDAAVVAVAGSVRRRRL